MTTVLERDLSSDESRRADVLHPNLHIRQNGGLRGLQVYLEEISGMSGGGGGCLDSRGGQRVARTCEQDELNEQKPGPLSGGKTH